MSSFIRALGSAAGTTPAGSNALTASVTANMTADDSIVVGIHNHGRAISSVTDSRGNTYVKEVENAGSSQLNGATLFTCKNPTPLTTSDTVTVHSSVTAIFLEFVVLEYVRLGTTDQTGSASNTVGSTSLSVSTSGSDANAADVVISVLALNGSVGALSAGTATVRTSTTQAKLADRDEATIGVKTVAWSWTTVRNSFAVVATFPPIPTQEVDPPFIPSVTQVYTPQLPVPLPFIASATAVYSLQLNGNVPVTFIASATVVYTPAVNHAGSEVDVPFISSSTRVFGVFSVFNPAWTGVGPGNGGQTFAIRLAPNGITETATLAAPIAADDLLIQLTGDSGFPAAEPFVATIDGEVVYLMPRGDSSYSVRGRGMSNTTATSHLAGVAVTWGDSYDMAIRAGDDIAHSFTADINSTGSFTYDAWLICFDSSQAYLAGSRYPLHVAQVLGVFDAGAGSTGTNRCDGAQPNAVAAATGVSDDCPAALSNPALVTTDIIAGDVALVRYTNPEASALDLGPRSAALQSWFGLKGVDATDHDVSLTDPTRYVVDTIPSGAGPGPFTGAVNHEWPNPVPTATGIAPDASDAAGAEVDTPNPVPWTTVTLPGTDRYFTFGPPHYSEKGWPICCLAVRQGNRRIPRWQSWDWHDYGYVYTGFGTDDTFCQLMINRNGIVFGGVPVVNLPGPQDIDGPDAVWDDGTYYIAASWYVVLFGAPYIVFGPTIGGTGGPGSGGDGFAPGVTFPGGASNPPTVTTPPTIEGGSGGDITPPPGGVLAWTKQGH